MHKRQPENISIALLFMRSNSLKRQMVKAGSFMSRRMLPSPKVYTSQRYDRLAYLAVFTQKKTTRKLIRRLQAGKPVK